ncbi:C-type mannose receptor 2-like [Perca flavescens]|uniref:C-type mannose receptor 2-like n=1 Tax=Perca flavescens TaxID=8167 RepID=UPI00106EC6C2|nr:C-type mannose receptor 2-like [Perca flavescens]
MGQCSSIGGHLYDYHFIGEKKTWKEAQEYCRKNHTDLATVSNQTDMKRLLNSTTEQYPDGAWIGRQNKTTNCVWRWSQPGVEFNKKHNISGKTFYISNFTMTWTEAQRFCRKTYTDLISGVNQLKDFKGQQPDYEQQCQPNKPCPFWIGLFRDSDWSWSDGSSFSFRSWDEDSVILINQSMIWEDALYYCRDHHGDLVSITNQDDQRWVQERAKMASTPHVWLGLRYTCTLDFWFWVSDETVLYKNWGPGQPGDDCNMSGAMDREGTWVKKIDDDHKLNFICSKNKPPKCN